MSARDQMSKMLDQLMGQNRDGNDSKKDKHFSDHDVCRPFLLNCCINDLFINTREEMGECSKVHSVTLKEEYERAQEKRDYHYEEEVLQYLQSFIRDNEKKIELNKKRIENVEEDPEMEKLAQEIHVLAVQIGEKVTQSEILGNEGKIDESLAALNEVEQIKVKKKRLEDDYHSRLPRHAQQQQKLRACEVCGAFLSMYDNDRRLADHFGGKLHMGFVQIREKVIALVEAIAKKSERQEKEREERRKRRSRSHSRERQSSGRSKEKDKDKGKDKDRRTSHRTHSQERRHERQRSRSRERKHNGSRGRSRSRSRDRVRSDYKER